MIKDKNENLGLDSILQQVKQQSNNFSNNKNYNNKEIEENKKKDKVVIQVRFDSSDYEILKKHLEKKGYDTYSTGVRGIIKKYMIDNDLI